MEKKIQEGPPIYMESLLEWYDYKLQVRVYPNTYNRPMPRNLSDFAPNEFKCRYNMGEGLTTEEIVVINKRIDQLRELLTSNN